MIFHSASDALQDRPILDKAFFGSGVASGATIDGLQRLRSPSGGLGSTAKGSFFFGFGPVGGSPSWWKQVEVAAEREGKIPCLIYKYDRAKDRCVMPLSAVLHEGEGLIETDFETFCFIARELMA